MAGSTYLYLGGKKSKAGVTKKEKEKKRNKKKEAGVSREETRGRTRAHGDVKRTLLEMKRNRTEVAGGHGLTEDHRFRSPSAQNLQDK